MLNSFYTLWNGVKIPKIGLGTWQLNKDDAFFTTLKALQGGYRHIDTAYAYGNEDSVGKAIAESGLKREDVFITTKLPSDIKTYEGAKEYFYKSLDNLKTSYIDLYLIHAPWPWSDVGRDCTAGNIEAWKALVDTYMGGNCRAIGVSNFHKADIEAVWKATDFKPMVNQIRYFIGNTQPNISDFCKQNDILVEAYSPLATGELVSNDDLLRIANKYNKSVPQLCIRYCLEKETLPLPKTKNITRLAENADVNFKISQADMDYLDSLYHIAKVQRLRD